jgi:hypothetical protein
MLALIDRRRESENGQREAQIIQRAVRDKGGCGVA